MNHFFKYLKFWDLFNKREDDMIYFQETVKLYTKLDPSMLRRFLEEYARASTERDVTNQLSRDVPQNYETYKEIKKLLTLLDKVDKNFWQSKQKPIR